MTIGKTHPTLVSDFWGDMIILRNPAKLSISTDNMVVGLTHQNKLTVFDVNERNNFSVISDIFESSIRHIEFDRSSDFVAVTGDK